MNNVRLYIICTLDTKNMDPISFVCMKHGTHVLTCICNASAFRFIFLSQFSFQNISLRSIHLNLFPLPQLHANLYMYETNFLFNSSLISFISCTKGYVLARVYIRIVNGKKLQFSYFASFFFLIFYQKAFHFSWFNFEQSLLVVVAAVAVVCLLTDIP